MCIFAVDNEKKAVIDTDNDAAGSNPRGTASM